MAVKQQAPVQMSRSGVRVHAIDMQTMQRSLRFILTLPSPQAAKHHARVSAVLPADHALARHGRARLQDAGSRRDGRAHRQMA
jgi:hypothetical protein